MKFKLFLSAALLLVGIASTPLARADEQTNAFTYGGTAKCAEVLAWIKSPRLYNEWGSWVDGLWSGMNAMDDSEANGKIGSNQTGIQLYKLVLTECRKNPSQFIQQATYTVWYRYRDLAMNEVSN